MAGAVASLVHDRDHGVGGVGHDSAEDTSPVTGEEGDHELSRLRVGALRGSEDVGIESLNGVLKGTELHHGVGDLTHPKGLDTLVEASPALGVHDLRPSLASSLGEGASVGGLHADLQL